MRSQPDPPFDQLMDLLHHLDSFDLCTLHFLIFSDFPLDLFDFQTFSKLLHDLIFCFVLYRAFFTLPLNLQYFLASPLDLSDLNLCDQCDTTKATSVMQQFGFCFIFVIFRDAGSDLYIFLYLLGWHSWLEN